MKKTISIIVALAMVFVMSFSVFAEGETSTTETTTETTTVPETEKPADPAELGKYYAEKFNEEGATVEFATEVAEDIATGYVTDVVATLTAFMENVDDQQAAYNFLKTVELAIKNTIDPDFELPVAPPGEEVPSEDPSEEPSEEDTLPEEEPSEDAGEDAGSGFLNTILGILGTIGDLIFGGSSGGDTDIPTDDGTTDDPFGSDDPWGDDGESDNGEGELSGGESSDAVPEDEAESENGEKEDELVSDTGDTTVLSVAAVALVAGAALILTRKKSEDAE